MKRLRAIGRGRATDSERKSSQPGERPPIREQQGTQRAGLRVRLDDLPGMGSFSPGEFDHGREQRPTSFRSGSGCRCGWCPRASSELLLADRIVSTAWRLRRLITVEGGLFDKEEVLANTFVGYRGDCMLGLSRFEVTLDRTLFKCLHELQRLRHRAGVSPSRPQKQWMSPSPDSTRVTPTAWL